MSQRLLTLYVLPATGDSIDVMRVSKSIGDVLKKVVAALSIDLIDEHVSTPWYMVLYDDEVADAQLMESFRSFLSLKSIDVFKIYKKLGPAPYRFFIAPRIFRSGIKLKENSLMPENCDDLKFETILNGWLENIDET